MAVVNEARAILTAEDRASAVLAMVARNFDRLDRAATRLNAQSGNVRAQERTQAGLARTTALLGGVSSAALRAAGPLAGVISVYGAGAALNGANRAFAQNERAMTRIAVTADASRAAQQASWTELQRLADETAQPVDKVREGLDALVASGRSLPEAMAFLPAVAKTAQASGSEVQDIAKTADSVGESFKLAGSDMQAAFDIMAAGGKAGKFELKDMARYLPSLGPAASAIGFEGKKGLSDLVAMLQVMRKGSGTAEEAVASMNNILAKMESDKTTKALKELGVDSEAAFKKARAEGKNLVEVFEELVNKALKGDRSRLGEIIDDMEFKRGVQALMMFKGEWQDLSRTMQASSAGTVATDLARVLADRQTSFDRLSNSASRFADIVGNRVGPAFKSMAAAATAALDAASEALKPGESDDERLNRIGNRQKTRAEQAVENAERARERQRKLDDPKSEYYDMRDGGFAGRAAKTAAAREAALRKKKSRTIAEQAELDQLDGGGIRAEAGKMTKKVLDDRSRPVEERVSSHMHALTQHRRARAEYAEEQGLKDYRERQAQRAQHLAAERAYAGEQAGKGSRSDDVYRDVDALNREKQRVERADDAVTAGDALTGTGEAGTRLQSAFADMMKVERSRSLTRRGLPTDADGGRTNTGYDPTAGRSTDSAARELKAAVEGLLRQQTGSANPEQVGALFQQLQQAAKALADKPATGPGADPLQGSGGGDAIKQALDGIKAEVKPDQITAKADVDVTSKVEVKVEQSPDFWAKVDARIEAKAPKGMGGVSLPGKEGGGGASSAASRF